MNLHVASVSHDRATSVCICPSHKSAYPFDAWAKRVDLTRGQLSIAGIARTPAAEGLAISIAEPKWHTIPLRSQGHISNIFQLLDLPIFDGADFIWCDSILFA